MASTVTTGRNQHIKVILTGPGTLSMSAKAVAAPTVTWGKTVTVTGTPPAVEPTGVTLTPSVPAGSVDFTAHSSFQVNASILPAGANRDTTLTWASSDTTVATVSSTGLVTLTGKAGSFSISVSTGNGKTAALSYTTAGKPKPVVVKPTNVTVTGLPSSFDVYGWQPVTLTASVTPDDATDKSVTWASSDTSVATLTGSWNTATLKLLKAGTVTFSCTANGDKNVKWSKTVTVIDSTPILPTSITVTGFPDTLDVYKPVSQRFMATVQPSNATVSSVTAVSSDTSVLTLNNAGGAILITLHKAGTATITITANGNPKVKWVKTVTVVDTTPILPKSITVSGLPATVQLDRNTSDGSYVPQSYSLTAMVTPSNAADKSVTWSVSAVSFDGTTAITPAAMSQYATITSGGLLTVRQPCRLTVKATCNADASVSGAADCGVSGKTILPTGVTINGLPSTADMASTKTIQLSAVVTPSNASDPTVTWSVSGPATITQDGLLTLTGTGDVTVTATSNAASSVTATASVTVSNTSGSAPSEYGEELSYTADTSIPIAVSGEYKFLALKLQSPIAWSNTDELTVTVSDKTKISYLYLFSNASKFAVDSTNNSNFYAKDNNETPSNEISTKNVVINDVHLSSVSYIGLFWPASEGASLQDVHVYLKHNVAGGGQLINLLSTTNINSGKYVTYLTKDIVLTPDEKMHVTGTCTNAPLYIALAGIYGKFLPSNSNVNEVKVNTTGKFDAVFHFDSDTTVQMIGTYSVSPRAAMNGQASLEATTGNVLNTRCFVTPF